jgi:hypothetical protein
MHACMYVCMCVYIYNIFMGKWSKKAYSNLLITFLTPAKYNLVEIYKINAQ